MEDQVRKIIAGILVIDVAGLTLATNITAIESWDSMAQVRIVAELEDAFSCSIPIERINSLRKVGDFVSVIS